MNVELRFYLYVQLVALWCIQVSPCCLRLQERLFLLQQLMTCCCPVLQQGASPLQTAAGTQRKRRKKRRRWRSWADIFSVDVMQYLDLSDIITITGLQTDSGSVHMLTLETWADSDSSVFTVKWKITKEAAGKVRVVLVLQHIGSPWLLSINCFIKFNSTQKTETHKITGGHKWWLKAF